MKPEALDFEPVGDPIAMRALATALRARAADVAQTVDTLRRTTEDADFEGPAGDRFFERLQETTSAGGTVAAELDELARRMLRDAGTVELDNQELEAAADAAATAAAGSATTGPAGSAAGPPGGDTAGSPAGGTPGSPAAPAGSAAAPSGSSATAPAGPPPGAAPAPPPATTPPA